MRPFQTGNGITRRAVSQERLQGPYNPGCICSTDLRPPPERRMRSAGSGFAQRNSRNPLAIVLRSSPLMHCI
jgi:hypothetical protein